MSRHRDYRNIDYYDYADDDDEAMSLPSTASSFADDELSSSLDQFMYKRQRSGSGSSANNFHFNVSSTMNDVIDSHGTERSESFDEDSVFESEVTKKFPSTSRDSPLNSYSSLRHNASDDDETVSVELRQAKLESCMKIVCQVIDLDEVDKDSHSPPVNGTWSINTVKDICVRCDYNAQLAINTILNNPAGFRSSPGHVVHCSQKENISIVKSTPSPLIVVNETTPINIPSAQQTKILDKKLLNLDISTNKGKSASLSLPPKKPLVKLIDTPTSKKIKTLSRGSSPRSGKHTGTAKMELQSPSVTTTSALVAMRKGNVDVTEQYESLRKCQRESVNLVVVGHVDSGKSTLMGHLLLKLGFVSKRTMHKFEQESKKIGKPSFAYAWVLDETAEERSRGITMDVGHSQFKTESKLVTLLDAPGHKDFIPNMIAGAYQADVAILVVNATKGEFEAGFRVSSDSSSYRSSSLTPTYACGQTREHALLVRSLGITHLLVAVNKMDTVKWDRHRFEDDIIKQLKAYLKSIGYKVETDVRFVPCSGISGENLINPVPNVDWAVKYGTLVSNIDNFFSTPKRAFDKPFRMFVSDVFKSGQSNMLSVGGRIESGYVQKDDKIIISPINEIVQVKAILVTSRSPEGNSDNVADKCAFAGDHVSISLQQVIHADSFSSGMVACDPARPVKVSKSIIGRILVFGDLDRPMIKGQPVVFHHGSVQVQGHVKSLIELLTNPPVKRPRIINSRCSATVHIKLDSPICAELYSESRYLGRFMLRVSGKTIAGGIITEIK